VDYDFETEEDNYVIVDEEVNNDDDDLDKYYARAIESTMLIALSDLTSEQAAPTLRTMEDLKWFLDYAACNPQRHPTIPPLQHNSSN